LLLNSSGNLIMNTIMKYTCEYSIFITTWIFNTFINNHDYLQIFQKLDFIIVFMIKLPLEFNNKYLRTITLVLYIGSLPNLATWFPCGRERILFILGSLPLYRLIIYIDGHRNKIPNSIKIGWKMKILYAFLICEML
jgi:hypothetical protein